MPLRLFFPIVFLAALAACSADSDAPNAQAPALATVDAKAEAQADVSAKAKDDTGPWAYTAIRVKGGTQYAASIENTPPLSPPRATGRDAVRVHLILRQHPEWGETVYLMLDNEKFNCKSGCKTLPIRFDDEPAKPWKSTIPPTGEPALFIDDEETFIARLLKSKKVAIDVVLAEGGRKTLVFETSGLDMSRLPKTTKRK